MTRYLFSFLLLIIFSSSILCAADELGKKKKNKDKPKPAVNSEESNNAEGNFSEDREGFSTETEALLESYTKLAEDLSTQPEEDKEMFVYRCKHIQGVTLKKIIDNFITSAGSVAESEEADIVVITDVKSNIPVLKRIAENIDQRVPQVLVEARVVELTIDNDFEKELSHVFDHFPAENDAFVRQLSTVLGTPGANIDTTQGGLFTIRPYSNTDKEGTVGNRLETFLRALESRGRAKILSAPNLILQRGKEGSIITGEERPILTQTVVSGSISTSTVFKSIGIKLKVKPIMISNETVRLSISPEVSTVSGFAQTGDGFANPIIAVRNATTELEVKNGQLISIGGLMRQEEREHERRVPLLSTIPVLGNFFSSSYKENVKSQLVIFLTIKILEEAKTGDVTIYHPNRKNEVIANEVKIMEKEMKHPKATIKSDIKLFTEESHK